MAAKKAKTEKGAEIVVKREGAEVRLYLRKNGMVAVAWREGGKQMRSTRTSMEKAKEWAERKVKELAMATGRVWISPADAERLKWLHKLAGGSEGCARLLADVEAARGLLGQETRLETAARWYAGQGLAEIGKRSVWDAVEAFMKEYEKHHPPTTMKGVKYDLRPFQKKLGHVDLLEVSHSMLEEFVRESGLGPRATRNRISHLSLFFHRAKALEWWPDGRKLPTAALKRPRKVQTSPQILTPEQAVAVLKEIEAEFPQHLSFVLIAGWLGCRPSECQRLRWSDFDWDHGFLHVRAEVAMKKAQERWVPVPPELGAWLKRLSKVKAHHLASAGLACRKNARAWVSAHLRKKAVLENWPQDVLRHSYITYRLQVLKNIDAVAEEAGNSPREIRDSYKRPIPPGVGEKWFAVVDKWGEKKKPPTVAG
jgi:integrase